MPNRPFWLLRPFVFSSSWPLPQEVHCNRYPVRATGNLELYDKLAALDFLAKTMGILDKHRRKEEAPLKVLVIEDTATKGLDPGDSKESTRVS